MCCSVCGTNHKRSGRLSTLQRSGTHGNHRVYPMVPWNAPLEREFHNESRPPSVQTGDRCAELSARNSKCRSGKYLFSGNSTLLCLNQITVAGFIVFVVYLSVTLAVSAPPPGLPLPGCCPHCSAPETLSQETTARRTGADEAKEEETSKRYSSGKNLLTSSRFPSPVPPCSPSRSVKTKTRCGNSSDEEPQGNLSRTVKTKTLDDNRVVREALTTRTRKGVEWIATSTVSASAVPCRSRASKGQNSAHFRSNDLTAAAVISNDNGDESSTRNDDAVASIDVKPNGEGHIQSNNASKSGFLRMASKIFRHTGSLSSSIKRDPHGKGASIKRDPCGKPEAQTKRSRSLLRRRTSLPKQSCERETPVHGSASNVEGVKGLRPDGSGPSEEDASTLKAPRVKRRSHTISLAESLLSFFSKEKRNSSSRTTEVQGSFRGLLRKKPKPKTQDANQSSLRLADGTSVSPGFKKPPSVDDDADILSVTSSVPPGSTMLSSGTNLEALSANELPTQKSSQEPLHAEEETATDREYDGLNASKMLDFIDVESGNRLGNLTLMGAPGPWVSSQGAVLPIRVQLGSTRYICFTLQTLNSALEKAEEQETLAILRALDHNKRILLESAKRLDAACNSTCSEAVWCVAVNESDTEDNAQGTFVLVGCEHVKYGPKTSESH